MAAQLLLFGVPGAAIPLRPVCVAVRVPADACWKCSGSGTFWTKGEDGRPVPGVCYPCRGKGFQTEADKRRTNYYYDHIFTVSA